MMLESFQKQGFSDKKNDTVLSFVVTDVPDSRLSVRILIRCDGYVADMAFIQDRYPIFRFGTRGGGDRVGWT